MVPAPPPIGPHPAGSPLGLLLAAVLAGGILNHHPGGFGQGHGGMAPPHGFGGAVQPGLPHEAANVGEQPAAPAVLGLLHLMLSNNPPHEAGNVGDGTYGSGFETQPNLGPPQPAFHRPPGPPQGQPPYINAPGRPRFGAPGVPPNLLAALANLR